MEREVMTSPLAPRKTARVQAKAQAAPNAKNNARPAAADPRWRWVRDDAFMHDTLLWQHINLLSGPWWNKTKPAKHLTFLTAGEH